MPLEAILSLIEITANFLREKKKLKIILLIISTITSLSALIFLGIYKEILADYIIAILAIIIVFSMFILVSSIFSLSDEPIRTTNIFEIELKELSEERKKLKEKANNSTSIEEHTVFNTILINLNQTTEYYTINKSQAKRSFQISVWAIVVGLVTILIGIWLIYFKDNIEMSILPIISGVLLEIVGSMYFHIYNKSINQLNYFYGKLEKMQDTMVAIELANSINDEKKKTELQEKIIIKLMERSSTIK